MTELLAAFSFLTTIRVPVGRLDDETLGRAVAWFPVVGAALGLALFAFNQLLVPWLPIGVRAALALALLAMLTGGLHLDGLADTFDGWAGGRGDRERTLDIMRDSRVGAHGAAALALTLLAQHQALAALLEHHAELLLVMPIAGRAAIVPLILRFDYARSSGLGSQFKAHAGDRELLLAGGVALGASALLAGLVGVVALVLAGLSALALALRLRRVLGGLTGDVYGAALELAQLGALLGALAVL